MNPGLHLYKIIAGPCLFACLFQVPAEEVPEKTFDGLQPVVNSRIDQAYVNPEADFSRYNKIRLFDLKVSFKKNWKSEHREVSRRDMERIKRRVAELFREVFTEILEGGGYLVVVEAGKDVLDFKPVIIDLDVKAPDVRTGRVYTYITNAGSATLYAELFDSETGSILARGVDHRTGREHSCCWMMRGTSVYNVSEARRVIKYWATLLKEHLDQFHITSVPPE